ncbi:AN1-type zinc finger protein 2A [Diabrotica virgifera virgifera]|uniref:AN1-type domain-containing protein n=1 Tax=Diabrotica virgifera virgifera TaxID=50390 RepID=A0ABM5JT28_DIAVI|nr:AN1-type zinc finger protein 2A [Diabrotica virgifera virgifera]
MEFPHLGKHCSKSDCGKLDFLPIKCDACKQLFCEEHFSYNTHSCPYAYQKDNQVPACPLCSRPIPVGKGEHPDFVVGAHIDNDCQSDPAKNRRSKVFTNRCSYNKCKTKELLPFVCQDCSKNFCIKHRHPSDHICEGKKSKISSRNTHMQTMISEDEALARALALSMHDNAPMSRRRQEELDMALARQLQASESQSTTGPSRSSDRCNVS